MRREEARKSRSLRMTITALANGIVGGHHYTDHFYSKSLYSSKGHTWNPVQRIGIPLQINSLSGNTSLILLSIERTTAVLSWGAGINFCFVCTVFPTSAANTEITLQATHYKITFQASIKWMPVSHCTKSRAIIGQCPIMALDWINCSNIV